MSVDLGVLPRPSSVDIPWLRLPDPGRPLDPCSGCAADFTSAAPPADPVARALHRWYLGHHGAFLAWRFLADALHSSDIAGATAAYDAYSAMFEYAGSCDRATYETVIRPRMRAVDPAFSGRWARDYERVPALLRQARTMPGAASLDVASKRSLRVHMAVGRRLVPGGVSLLRSSGRGLSSTTERQRDLFDEFFLVRREPCCETAYRAQVRGVYSGILDDLQRHPVPGLGSDVLHDFINRH